MKKRSIPRTPEKQMVIVRRSSRISNSSSIPVYREASPLFFISCFLKIRKNGFFIISRVLAWLMKFGFFFFCFLQVDVKRVQIQRRWNCIKISSFCFFVPWIFEIRLVFCLVLVLFRGLSKRRDLSNRVYVSEEIREEAFSRAEKVQDELESGYPSFVKSMLQSHVSGGFWLVSGNQPSYTQNL